MQLRENRLFIACSLVLFYPVGLFLLLRSPLNKKIKWIAAIAGAILFIGMLSLSLLGRQQDTFNTDQFELLATRYNLSIGQSGGLALYNNENYYCDFKVESDNTDILEVRGNLYTAKAPGKCTLTVTFLDEVRKMQITVYEKPDTSATVYITPHGERYHINQKHAGETALAVTEEDALMSSKTPCKLCYKN